MELLKKLYCIHSKSRKEDDMLEFLLNWLFENFPTNADVEMDKKGNIYVTKGTAKTYPCIVAHVDQVQTLHSDDFEVIETKDILFGFSNKNRRTEGLGADDKNGVWIALKCLFKYDAIKIALFVGEEIGCVGSSEADMAFFDDCKYVLQCDRRGFGDLITEASLTELCSKEFTQATQCELFNYKETSGMMTDVMTLKENGLKVSCVNISCGYYEPHTDREFTIKYDLLNCLDFVQHIIEKVKDVYPHEYVYVPKTYGYGGYYNGYGSKYTGYWGEDGKWHTAYNSVGYTASKNGVSNTKKEKTPAKKETLATDKKNNQIQKFWDDEKKENSHDVDWVDEITGQGLDEQTFVMTEDLRDEIYDKIFSLISACPNASYDMIRSAILNHYPNLDEKELSSIHGEVKYDLKKYYALPCE